MTQISRYKQNKNINENFSWLQILQFLFWELRGQKPFKEYREVSKCKQHIIIPGCTHIFGQTEMCRSNGSLFYKKSLNMGPVFYKKILKHGSTFLTEPKFSGFRMAKTPKIPKFLKNGPIFQEKSLKMGTLFCQNHP